MSYRPEHAPNGSPCTRLFEKPGERSVHVCGYPASKHRVSRPRKARPGRYVRLNEQTIVAIDGEGQGRSPHVYTYLAAVDEHGEVRGEVRNRFGLTTAECLNFFLEIGVGRVFGFSLSYDLTKILGDLPDAELYRLNRPEKRRRVTKKGRVVHDPIVYGGFSIGYMRGKMTVQRSGVDPLKNRRFTYGPTVVIWDVFRFFGSKFTTALTDWSIRSKPELEKMTWMKDHRDEFDKLVTEGRITAKDIEDYCKDECKALAQLVRELIEAHENVGLRLRVFYGAGSTASALMSKLGVKEFMTRPPDEMRVALACGFFGGRFEISRSGPIEGPIYNYDISSAYPYHISRLPCLTCGVWEKVTGKPDRVLAAVKAGTLALVHVKYVKNVARSEWGPFPWRSPKGEIVFPLRSAGTWVWKDEFLAGLDLFSQVAAKEAWVYRCNCDHRPFGTLPDFYRERLRIGKEGRGIVIKLGMNSLYGKMAQSVGQAPFQSYVWAGVITSNTRAQLLRALGATREWWDVLMFATDGVFSTCPLTLPTPEDTGTFDTGKPLGGWEEKVYERGIFLMRPGIYFPLNPTDDEIKQIKARGMSNAVLLKNAQNIQEHWETKGPSKHFDVFGLQRFVGMKTGVLEAGKKGVRRSEDYGEWVDYPIQASFKPDPKRERFLAGHRLKTFEFFGAESAPYTKANRSMDKVALQQSEAFFFEQAEGDFLMKG